MELKVQICSTSVVFHNVKGNYNLFWQRDSALKKNILSSFTHRHAVPNLYDFLSSVAKNKIKNEDLLFNTQVV